MLPAVWYWFFKFVGIGPAAIAVLGPVWHGRENLPRTGPFVIAANHQTMLDSPFVSLGVPRKVIFVAKLKYYQGRGLKGRLLAWFLTAIGQTPIDPATADSAAPALDTARDLLRGGGVWAVYPEGTRSPDGTHIARSMPDGEARFITPDSVANPSAPMRRRRRDRGADTPPESATPKPAKTAAEPTLATR